MATFNLDPPGSNGSLQSIQNYLANLHDTLEYVLNNLDDENMNEDFLSRLNVESEDE